MRHGRSTRIDKKQVGIAQLNGLDIILISLAIFFIIFYFVVLYNAEPYLDTDNVIRLIDILQSLRSLSV